jgi:DNA-binding response OmpR family regulator
VQPAATILIVDDSVPVLHLLRSILQGESFEVLTAESGEQALDLAVDRDLDLVVLDAMMPGLSGFEACAELRQLARHHDTPVLFLTGLTDLRTYQQAIDVGGDDLLGKPINRTGLLIRVRSLLRLAELRRTREVHVRRLEEQARAMARMERRRGELVDSMMHDLQPPLTAIRTHVRRLKGAETAEGVALAADELEHEASVLDRLVTNLALVAPGGEGLEAVRETLDIATLVEEVCARARQPAERRGIELLLQCMPDAPRRVDGDSELLRSALDNLLDHARRSCHSGDRISVSVVGHNEHAVVVRVHDPGRASEDSGLSTDPAVTGSLPRGRGLGLDYGRAVAEVHGGQLSVTSGAEGLVAELLLPALG